MSLLQRNFVLFLVFIYSLGSVAQENNHFYQLTKEACQVYPGDSPSNYVIEPSRQYENPLSGTSLGQMVLKESFQSAYKDYDYALQREALVQMIQSTGFKKAMDECYKDKALAKSYFVFFITQLDMQAKTSSLYSEAAGFVGSGMVFVKFSKFIIQRLKWTQGLFKWAGRTIIVSIAATVALTLGQGVYKLVRQFNDGLGNETNEATKEKIKEAEAYQELADGSILTLEESILNLKIEIKNATSEAEKNNLQVLLNESELVVRNLRQKLSETRKKLKLAS